MKFELIYQGNDTELNEIDFYDVAQAMVGFQRSLALTTHLVLNGQIITQAPSLRGARVLLRPPEAGSYKIPAYITSLSLAVYGLGTADTDTPVGHLVYSAYDYAVHKALGFHVDFDEALGEQFERSKAATDGALPNLTDTQVDSLIEKIEPALKEMHRLFIKSKTAANAVVLGGIPKSPFKVPLTDDSYYHLIASTQDTELLEFDAKVSSYNINTFKGRAYLATERRPIPFMLDDVARSPDAVAAVTASLRANAKQRLAVDGDVRLIGYANRSPTGRLKSLTIVDVN